MAVCYDHLGNEYKSRVAMCKHYNISVKLFEQRTMLLKWNVEEALTLPKGTFPHKKDTSCYDHLGNKYPDISAMCKAYDICVATYHNRKNKGYSLEEILTMPKIHKSGSSVICYDHLGNEYTSKRDRARAYNINETIVNDRLKRKWSLKDALTTPTEDNSIKDHNGKTYSSERAMCRAYGIDASVYRNRIKKGWTVEQALTVPPGEKINKIKDHLGNEYNSAAELCKKYNISAGLFVSRRLRGYSIYECIYGKENFVYDHLGNEYESERQMAEAYGLPYSRYCGRKEKGWPLEKILTTEKLVGCSKKCKDHLGNEYSSTSAMCSAYNVDMDTYTNRLKRGWSLEDALTSPRYNKNIIKDHLGHVFNSKKELCEYYNIKRGTFDLRLKKGWSLEDALTKPLQERNATEKHKDHLGRGYTSISAMCKAWHTAPSTYRTRKEQGYSTMEALTGQGIRYYRHKDHLGNNYETLKEMCDNYGIKINTYRNRKKAGWSLEEILTTPMYKTRKSKKEAQQKVCDHLGNKYNTKKEMCEHYNIKPDTFDLRIKQGYSLEEALTTVVGAFNGVFCEDHQGNKYNSIREMCDHYGIHPSAYQRRLTKMGWSVEKALTTPSSRKFVKMETHIGEKNTNNQGLLMEVIEVVRIGKQTNINVRFEDGAIKLCRYDAFKRGMVAYPKKREEIKKDHLGNEYETTAAMCKHWNITTATLTSRIKCGWTLEKALTTPLTRIKTKDVYCSYQRTFNGKHYYKCTSKKWDKAKILTLDVITEKYM